MMRGIADKMEDITTSAFWTKRSSNASSFRTDISPAGSFPTRAFPCSTPRVPRSPSAKEQPRLRSRTRRGGSRILPPRSIPSNANRSPVPPMTTGLDDLKAKRTATEEELAKLKEQWEKEKELVDQIRNIRLKLEMSRLDAKLARLVTATATVRRHRQPGRSRRRGCAVAETAAAETAIGDAETAAAAPAPSVSEDTELLKVRAQTTDRRIERGSGRRSA